MGRWEPDAAGRFRAAAMELFVERSYEQTTVTDIAERAGLTARTFFRYFADKREVLFDGSKRLQQMMVTGLESAPAAATPIEAIAAALQSTAGFFNDNREFGRQRLGVINGTAELRERELIKMAMLSAALAEALRGRGTPEPEATLAGEAGIAVFRVAFKLWVADSEQRSFSAIVTDSLARFRTIAGNVV